MAELKNFRLPDVGEGLTEADIVKWHVQPGDEITINQIIVEIETAKAIVELPSPYAGVVADLLVAEGQTADVGTPIIVVKVGSGAVSSGPGGSGPGGSGPGGSGPGVSGAAGAADPELITTESVEGGIEPGMHGALVPKEERQAVLVGYGVKLGATQRR